MINTTTDYLVLIATIYWSKYPILMVIVGSGVASSYNLSDLLSSSNTQIIAHSLFTVLSITSVAGSANRDTMKIQMATKSLECRYIKVSNLWLLKWNFAELLLDSKTPILTAL